MEKTAAMMGGGFGALTQTQKKREGKKKKRGKTQKTKKSNKGSAG